MDREEIENEVRRLAPWYYLFDLSGVRTDIAPPCDDFGHRAEPRLPDAARIEIAGRSVLDCGCNEGGYSFSAVDCGASHVDAFDVRDINVEKARFVAKVRGIREVAFQVSSCDEWIESTTRSWDFVLLCGLLYHLVEPWKTIADMCARAERGVFVTCVLAGGEDGYTPLFEEDNLAASEDPTVASQKPNTARTIVGEFAKHGFHPVLLSESRRDLDGLGGCSVFFRRLRGARLVDLEHTGRDTLDLHLAPGRNGSGFGVMVYNRTTEPLTVSGTVTVRDGEGNVLQSIGPGPLDLDPRGRTATDPPSTSGYVELQSGPTPPLPLVFDIDVRSRTDGSRLGFRSVRLEKGSSPSPR